MFKSPLEGRIYHFAGCFLWDSLAFFHYLDEEVAKGEIGRLRLKWSSSFEKLANWGLEAQHFPRKIGGIAEDEDDILFTTSERLGDSLGFRWKEILETASTEMHAKYPEISKSMWAYYLYCQFLRQVITEFDQVMHESFSRSSQYYEHYLNHIDLFHNIVAAIENERPFLDAQSNVNAANKEAAWHEVNTCTTKLGDEWKQAVLSAAQSLKLPDSWG